MWPNPPRSIETIADGMRTQQLGQLTWPIVRDLVEKIVFTVVQNNLFTGRGDPWLVIFPSEWRRNRCCNEIYFWEIKSRRNRSHSSIFSLSLGRRWAERCRSLSGGLFAAIQRRTPRKRISTKNRDRALRRKCRFGLFAMDTLGKTIPIFMQRYIRTARVSLRFLFLLFLLLFLLAWRRDCDVIFFFCLSFLFLLLWGFFFGGRFLYFFFFSLLLLFLLLFRLLCTRLALLYTPKII